MKGRTLELFWFQKVYLTT